MKLLTAKPELVRREAQIVAAAGMPGSVTLATNMAGELRHRPSGRPGRRECSLLHEFD